MRRTIPLLLLALSAAIVGFPPAAQQTAPASAPDSTAQTANADDPNTPHPPGVYILVKGPDGTPQLTELQRAIPKGMKTSGILAHAYTAGIAKAHAQAVLDGAKAAVEIAETNPVFYMYIPVNNNAFGGSGISVRDFVLVKLDVKGDTRVVNTASIGFASVSSGTDEKARQGFATETVKPGIYKLTLEKPLPPGEYAFQHTTHMYYDFGIQSAK
jgi:hypothetical protein